MLPPNLRITKRHLRGKRSIFNSLVFLFAKIEIVTQWSCLEEQEEEDICFKIKKGDEMRGEVGGTVVALLPLKLTVQFRFWYGKSTQLQSHSFIPRYSSSVVNLIKHFMIVIYDSRVVWLGNCPCYDSRVVNYDRKMFIRLATGLCWFHISLKFVH